MEARSVVPVRRKLFSTIAGADPNVPHEEKQQVIPRIIGSNHT
jgi:hypothetical protein